MAFCTPTTFRFAGKALTSQVTCSFLFNFFKVIRVRSRCSYHNRYHHHFVYCLFSDISQFSRFPLPIPCYNPPGVSTSIMTIILHPMPVLCSSTMSGLLTLVQIFALTFAGWGLVLGAVIDIELKR